MEKLLKQFNQALRENNTELIKEISSIFGPNYIWNRGSVSILNREHQTTIIGKQEWMAENLYCPELGFHYDNDPENSEGGNGTLHTHYSIPAIQELLPEDWRVPTDEDWDILIKYVGNDAGKKLKSKTGSYRYNALPSGFRYSTNSQFYARGREAGYWSSSVGSSSNAWSRVFYYNSNQVHRRLLCRSNGISIRCVRDIVEFKN